MFFSWLLVVQLLSCVQLFVAPLDCGIPGFPVLHYPRVCSDSRPLSQWCCLTISSSVILFSSCLQSFPASGSFPMSRLFASHGQNIGTSASVLPTNIKGWFPLGLTGLISMLSKGFFRVFSSTIVQKQQFFSGQPSLWSDSHICTWLLDADEFGWSPGVGDGQGGLACCDAWGRKESDTTERLNWAIKTILF